MTRYAESSTVLCCGSGESPHDHRASHRQARQIPVPSAHLLSFLGTRSGRTALSWIIDYFHASLDGQEHIPRQGGALIVSNHALLAIDSVVLGALLVRDFGRNPRFLVDRKIWQIPGLRQAISAVGGLAGEPHAAAELLKQGELVIVYPGGVDDSLKAVHERYQLKWKARAGFAKVALVAHTPIVPVVGLGIDEMYSVLAREPWIGRRIFGSARYDLPVAFGAFGTPMPRRVPQKYIALPPIDTRGDPASAQDVERIRAATYSALEAQLRLLRRS